MLDKNADQTNHGTQIDRVGTGQPTANVKPISPVAGPNNSEPLVGHEIQRIVGLGAVDHQPDETQAWHVGGQPKRKRPESLETQARHALAGDDGVHTPAEAQGSDKPVIADIPEVCARIREHHRKRRFAMKIQQKLDRALESFIRVNATEWSPDLDEKERKKINAEVLAIIKRTRSGESDLFGDIITTNDAARVPADELRHEHEKQMEELANILPVYQWCMTVRGIGALGLATIIAETGDLSNYPNVGKVWKRLGFAPYDGLAGSSWKRETWRPRALTAEEWTENPFSGERYALIHQSALWLKNAQWIGKAKTEDGKGKPNGPYGEIYANRREHTAISHADWTLMHSHMDALRVMMKAFLCDLWVAWDPEKRKRPPWA